MSSPNEKIFHRLMAAGKIKIQHGRLFNAAFAPKPADFDFAKVEGMLLGIAIGDSLGVPTESLLPEERNRRYGEIRDYIPNRHTSECRGFPSDDTQLSFWMLDQLVRDQGFRPENVANRFSSSGRIFGIGNTVRQFLANMKSGIPWQESGVDSAGNGALMRTAVVALRYLDNTGAPAAMYPANPNGSPDAIAGLTSVDGRATILMPHPERTLRTLNFSWHPADWPDDSPWLRMFRNARRAVG